MINLQKQSHSWLTKGNPNVQLHAALLDAEMAALKKKRVDARPHYERAVNLATRRGVISLTIDTALANERYSEYLLYDLKETMKAPITILSRQNCLILNGKPLGRWRCAKEEAFTVMADAFYRPR
jgi:hypothetical protein